MDLGVGDASLSKAAYARWSDAKYFATEIEVHKVKEIKDKLTFIKVYNYDSLQPYLYKKLKLSLGLIDVAICNPPYIAIKNSKIYEVLFTSIGCQEFSKIKRITSELVFFAHNLMLLRNNGELGIILSDSLITGKYYRKFRETILQHYDIKRIIQLPDNIFNRTEARTHIIILSKHESTKDYCELYLADMNGGLTDGIKINKEKLKDRMDYSYFIFNNSNSGVSLTLSEIGAEISRGKFSSTDLKLYQFTSFHSTNFTKSSVVSFNRRVDKKYLNYVAQKGDILMCRVGKRSVGKTVLVKKGMAIISDCIYRIKVPTKYQTIVWKSLISETGQNWLKANAHGVCSQVISKCDLEKFPIYIK